MSNQQFNQNDYTISYRVYGGEHDLPALMELIEPELPEPYNIYTYRWFLIDWPHLCYFALAEPKNILEDAKSDPIPIGVVVSKLEEHRCTQLSRGYIAMLAVHPSFRSLGIATWLVQLSCSAMLVPPPSTTSSTKPWRRVEEIVLETEVSNTKALQFYAKFGFARDKRLARYYFNGEDAFRLVLRV